MDTSLRGSNPTVRSVSDEEGQSNLYMVFCPVLISGVSALEIVTKLCDVDFARRAKAADFLGRAWEVLREAGGGDGDKVSANCAHVNEP